ncbi:MAG: hypothetical protein A2583_02175 [Bdellovibrionales bacterium RIFOXYD1_FULL_53_11]|nr:MAG: hypothetical protein A2583_02175 [Bdellovibrionales bacterium RIFOXYD1_FULL_53_11]
MSKGGGIRLVGEETDAIIRSCSRVFEDTLRNIHLYGSRTDPSKRGGDIDLWIELETEPADPQTLKRQLRIALEDSIGERKVDILLTGPRTQVKDSQTLAFIKIISDKMVTIWRKTT